MPPEGLLFLLIFSVGVFSVSSAHSIEVNIHCPEITATICRTLSIWNIISGILWGILNGMASDPFCDWAGFMPLESAT